MEKTRSFYNSILKNEAGVGLLLVMGSITLLSFLLATFSYNVQVNKSPRKRIASDERRNTEAEYEEDVELKRIPLREVFVRVDVVQKAFDRAGSNVKNAIDYILKRINRDNN